MPKLLQQSYSLTLAAADEMANAAIKAVGDLKTHKPMCITVLDSAGGILVQKRMDGCPDGAYVKFSYAKARTCIHLQTSSRVFREKYTGSGEAPKFTQAASMVSVMDGELVPVAGGVLIQSEGEIPTSFSFSDAFGVAMLFTLWFVLPCAHHILYLNHTLDGSAVGAIGVSGAAADEDEYLAWKGVQAVKLSTVPENHCCKTLK